MKKIIKYLPLLSAFLIFNGFLKLYLYYDHWDIKIIEYLDFSEILLSFLSDINIFVLGLIIYIFPRLFSLALINTFDKKQQATSLDLNSKNQTNHSEKTFFDINEYLPYYSPWVFFIVSIILTVISSWMFFNNFTLLWLYIGIPLLSYSLYNLLILLENLLPMEDFLVGIVIFPTIIAFTYCLAFREIKTIEQNIGQKITTIYTENETITTSKNNILLGKTQKFIYLFDNVTNCTRIIPSDKIKSIETQRNN